MCHLPLGSPMNQPLSIPPDWGYRSHLSYMAFRRHFSTIINNSSLRTHPPKFNREMAARAVSVRSFAPGWPPWRTQDSTSAPKLGICFWRVVSFQVALISATPTRTVPSFGEMHRTLPCSSFSRRQVRWPVAAFQSAPGLLHLGSIIPAYFPPARGPHRSGPRRSSQMPQQGCVVCDVADLFWEAGSFDRLRAKCAGK